MRARVLALSVLVAACGTATPAARPSPPPRTAAPSASPVLSGSVLFGVLESHATGLGAGMPLGPHDTAAITGLDAVARAKTSYRPRPQVYVGNAAAVYPPIEAYAGDARLWFVDGLGAVHWLAPDGREAVAARFGLAGEQQEISFAVSPDGSRVEAVRLTLPAKGPPAAGAPFPTLVGSWRQEVLESKAGVVRTLRTWQAPATSYPDTPGSFQSLELVGWDQAGPIALVGNAIGTQNAAMDQQRIFSGRLAHLDATGRPTDPITPPDCLPVGLSSGGMVVCVNSGGAVTKFEVLSAGGQVAWGWTPTVQPPGQITGGLTLSPDGARMAMLGGVVARDGTVRKLPDGFHPEGWLDPATIFGRLDGKDGPASGDAGLVRTGDLGRALDLGFRGDLVGVVAA